MRRRAAPARQQFAADESKKIGVAECFVVEPVCQRLEIRLTFEYGFRVCRRFGKSERRQNNLAERQVRRSRESLKSNWLWLRSKR
jgi:hypothetical protein